MESCRQDEYGRTKQEAGVPREGGWCINVSIATKLTVQAPGACKSEIKLTAKTTMHVTVLWMLLFPKCPFTYRSPVGKTMKFSSVKLHQSILICSNNMGDSDLAYTNKSHTLPMSPAYN